MLKYILVSLLALGIMSCSDTIRIVNDGILIEEYQINKDSLRHGTTRKFFADGQVFELSYYENGVLNGERLLYYSDGTVEIKENYCNGTFCDTLTTYYPNGLKKIVGVYTNGVMNGTVRGYYDTGELKEEVTFIDNIEQGAFREYHKNGSLMWTGTYLNGPNEFGILMEFDEKGELLKKMVCDSLAVCETVWPKKS